MANIQNLWSNMTIISTPVSIHGSEVGSRMYRENDSIFYEYHTFDTDDMRTYSYFGKFGIDDYRRAIEKLQKTGEAELEGPNLSYSLTMKKHDDSVLLKFSGTAVSRDPGGRSVMTITRDAVKINDLLLKNRVD